MYLKVCERQELLHAVVGKYVGQTRVDVVRIIPRSFGRLTTYYFLCMYRTHLIDLESLSYSACFKLLMFCRRVSSSVVRHLHETTLSICCAG